MSEKHTFLQDPPGLKKAEPAKQSEGKPSRGFEGFHKFLGRDLTDLEKKEQKKRELIITAERRQERINKFKSVISLSLLDFVRELERTGYSTADAEDVAGIAIKIALDVKSASSKSKPQIALPKKARKLWTGNHLDDDNPATFIMREYAEYMGKGLTTGTIRRLDPTLASLYSAWKNPKEGPPPELPAGFELPSARKAIDQRDSALTPEDGSKASSVAGRVHRKKQRAKGQAQDR